MATTSTSVSAREFRTALLKIANNIVWKDSYRAAEAENGAYAFQIDRYLMYARMLKQYFATATLNTIFDYTYEEFEEWLSFYNPTNATEAQKAQIMAALRYMHPNSPHADHYVEHNDYYRMLCGLPSESTPSSKWVYPEGFYDDLENKHFEFEDAVQLEGSDKALSIVMFDRSWLTETKNLVTKVTPVKKFTALAFIKSITITVSGEIAPELRFRIYLSNGSYSRTITWNQEAAGSRTIEVGMNQNVRPNGNTVSCLVSYDGMDTVDADVMIEYIDAEHVYQYGEYYYTYNGIWESDLQGGEQVPPGVYYSLDYQSDIAAIRRCMNEHFDHYLDDHQSEYPGMHLISSTQNVAVIGGGNLNDVKEAIIDCVYECEGVDMRYDRYGAYLQFTSTMGTNNERIIAVRYQDNAIILSEWTASNPEAEKYQVGTIPVVRGDIKKDKYGQAIKIPVHLWNIVDVTRWVRTDEYQQFIADHPGDDYQYLLHLTDKKIYPYLAREAGRFELLYCPTSDPDILSTRFRECYTMSRDYFVNVFYTEAMAGREGRYYESFSALAILFMAINQMNYKYLDADIDREFYDLDSLRLLYEAYSVPFYENIPLKYHKQIVKNINRLIKYKGSNKVFYELCDLFEYDILGIYQYYLLKQRRFDHNGNPVCAQTQAVDVAGQPQWETYTQLIAQRDLETFVNARTRVPSKYIIPVGTRLEILGTSGTRYEIEGAEGKHYWVAMDDSAIRQDTIKHQKLQILTTTQTYETYDAEWQNKTGWELKAGQWYDCVTDEEGNIIKKQDPFDNGDCVSIIRHTENPDYDGKTYWIKLSQNTAILTDAEWITDGYGNRVPKMTDDLDQMYSISFMKANIESDPFHSLNSLDDQITYETLTEPDSYWFHDQDTIRTVYENEYNFVETKYIGVQLTFELSKLTYEACYFMKMLQDNAASFSENASHKILVEHDRASISVPLFDFIVYIFAAICKKNKMPGVIPTNPAGIARVYGYNYKGIFEKLRENTLRGLHIKKDYQNPDGSYTYDFAERDLEVGNNKMHGDDIQGWMTAEQYLRQSKEGNELYNRIVSAMHNLVMDARDPDTVKTAYNALADLMDQIQYHIFTCDDVDEYEAWLDLYRIMYTTELMNEVWTKDDGELATSYMDLLEGTNPSLWSRLDNMDEIELVTEINYCLVQLQKLCDRLQFIEYIDGVDIDIITEYLYAMLRYFKSAKVDLTDFDLVFKISNRTDNFLKIMDKIFDSSMTSWIDDDFSAFHDAIVDGYYAAFINDEWVFRFNDHIVNVHSTFYPYGDDPKNSLVEKFHTHIPMDQCKYIEDWDVQLEPGWFYSEDGAGAPDDGWFFGRTVEIGEGTYKQEVYHYTYGQRSHVDAKYHREYYNGEWKDWHADYWTEEKSGYLIDRLHEATMSDAMNTNLNLVDDPMFIQNYVYNPYTMLRTTEQLREGVLLSDDCSVLYEHKNVIGDGVIEGTPLNLEDQSYYFTALASPTDPSDPWGLYDRHGHPDPELFKDGEVNGLKGVLFDPGDLPIYEPDKYPAVVIRGYTTLPYDEVSRMAPSYVNETDIFHIVTATENGIFISNLSLIQSPLTPSEYLAKEQETTPLDLYYRSTHCYAIRNTMLFDTGYLKQAFMDNFVMDLPDLDSLGLPPENTQAVAFLEKDKRYFCAQIMTYSTDINPVVEESTQFIYDVSEYGPFLNSAEISLDMRTKTGTYRSDTTFVGFTGAEYWYRPEGTEHLYSTKVENDIEAFTADPSRFLSSTRFEYSTSDSASLKNGQFNIVSDTSNDDNAFIVTVRCDDAPTVSAFQTLLRETSNISDGFSIIWKTSGTFYDNITYDESNPHLISMFDIDLTGLKTVTSSNCRIETGTLR